MGREEMGRDEALRVCGSSQPAVAFIDASVLQRPGKAKQRLCLLLITASSPEAITVHSVPNIDEASVTEAQYFVKKMRTLGMRAEPKQSGGHKRINEWAMTPDSAKKCRVLEVHPSGASF